MNNTEEVFCPNCHIRMVELNRTVFQCYKCGVKIMKNEAVAVYELGKIINHFKHEHKQKQFNNNKQSSLDQFW